MKLTRLQWIAGRFYALAKTQPEDKWRSRFPAKIIGVLISYLFGEQAIYEPRPRLISPRDDTYDNSAYAELCAGVLISSETSMTTCGVCVTDQSGAKYITAAIVPRAITRGRGFK